MVVSDCNILFYSILWPVLCDIQIIILRMEINQASGDQLVRGGTHYDTTMGNNIARDAHWDITMSNDVTRDIHCDVTISNDIDMYISWHHNA